MPTDIPTPLPGWAKTLIKVTNALPHSFLYDLLTYFEETADPTTLEWRRLAVKFDNQANADPADDFWVTFDIANITGGALDTTWTTADYTTCETAMTTMWNSIKTYLTNQILISEYRWYRRRYQAYGYIDPISGKPQVFVPSGPPDRVTPVSIAGSSANPVPPQVAMSVTEKTAWPKHWGRFYIPCPAQTLYTTGGQFNTPQITAICTAVKTCYDALHSGEFFVVVPTQTTGGAPDRGLLQVTQVQVDSVPDVIRRRRPKTALAKVVLP